MLSKKASGPCFKHYISNLGQVLAEPANYGKQGYGDWLVIEPYTNSLSWRLRGCLFRQVPGGFLGFSGSSVLVYGWAGTMLVDLEVSGEQQYLAHVTPSANKCLLHASFRQHPSQGFALPLEGKRPVFQAFYCACFSA